MNRQPLQGLLQRLETRKYSAVTAELTQSNPEHKQSVTWAKWIAAMNNC
jgi:hypothetical protein